MFYAESDTFTGNHPSEYTKGFANTSKVIAFNTKKERDVWLAETKLLTAKALTAKEALSMTEWTTDSYYTGHDYDKVKACEIYGSEGKFHILKGKNW